MVDIRAFYFKSGSRMQYTVVSALILIKLISQVAGQSTPPPTTDGLNSSPSPGTPSPSPGTPSPSPGTPSPSPGTPSSSPGTPSPSPGTPSPSPGTPPPTPGTPSTPPTTPGSSPTPGGSVTNPPAAPGSGSGTGTPGAAGADNLPCIKNLLQLCKDLQAQVDKVTEYYRDTRFLNTYIYTFHNAMGECNTECDTLLQLDCIRQTIIATNGQPGPSTHVQY